MSGHTHIHTHIHTYTHTYTHDNTTVKGEIIEGLNNFVFADIWVFKH